MPSLSYRHVQRRRPRGMRMVPGAKCTVLDSTVRSGGEKFGREEEEEREGEGEGGAKFGQGGQLGRGAVIEES